MVEFALVTPLLVLVIFAIIDFSWIMFSYISVRQGTSATAREAAVVQTDPPPTASCPIVGGPFSATDNSLICYAKTRIGLDASQTRVSIWFPTSGCSGACYASGAPVVVCTQYPGSSQTGLFAALLNPIVLASKVEISIENTDSDTTLLPVQETPLPGSTWPAACQQP